MEFEMIVGKPNILHFVAFVKMQKNMTAPDGSTIHVLDSSEVPL
jgi:hypothetical protein